MDIVDVSNLSFSQLVDEFLPFNYEVGGIDFKVIKFLTVVRSRRFKRLCIPVFLVKLAITTLSFLLLLSFEYVDIFLPHTFAFLIIVVLVLEKAQKCPFAE